MPIIARDNRKEFSPAPEGLHQAVCVDVVDLGMVTSQYGEKHKVRLVWQIEEVDERGKRFLVMQQYTLSLNEKAVLRHHLEAWRGRKFTAEELEGFDLEKLIGVNAQLQIVHNLGAKGGVFANVQAVVPISKSMTKMRAEDYVRVQDRAPVASDETHDQVESEEDVPF